MVGDAGCHRMFSGLQAGRIWDKIDLSDNHITKDGIQYIAWAFKQKKLGPSVIILKNNQIDDRGIESFVQCMTQDEEEEHTEEEIKMGLCALANQKHEEMDSLNSLRYLDVSNNSISTKGAEYLL